MSSRSCEGLSTGQKVTLSVRPEALKVNAFGPATNRFDATLHDTMYLGEVAQHAVSLKRGDGRHELRAFELNPKVVARDGATESATISVEPADVVVLKD